MKRAFTFVKACMFIARRNRLETALGIGTTLAISMALWVLWIY